MLKLSKKADYALILMTHLAGSNGVYISIREISEQDNVPYKFLSLIATELKKAHLVQSKEGVSGGYRLAKDPEDISLKDIITAIEGPLAPVACLRGESCDCAKACRHKSAMKNVTNVVDQALANQTIADLIA